MEHLKTGTRPPCLYSDARLLPYLQHSFLFLPNVAACHAMANLLAAACKRLGLPAYSQRALRRTFITRCIEKGIDVKVIAQWQGHQDGGKLILGTYSHVRNTHAEEMAKLLTV